MFARDSHITSPPFMSRKRGISARQCRGFSEVTSNIEGKLYEKFLKKWVDIQGQL